MTAVEVPTRPTTSATTAAAHRRAPLPAPLLRTLPDAVAANVRTIRRATAAQIMAVVKADGYGHGALAVAKAAVGAGATWLGVTDLHEALTLRAGGVDEPILSWLNPSGVDAEQAARHRIDVAAGSVEELRDLIAAAPSPIRVHLHMDTGMARGGCPMQEWPHLLRLAREGEARGAIRVVAVMGHLPNADEGDPGANRPAVLRMRQAREAALRAGLGPLIVHLAATAGTLTDRDTHLDMVRIGAGLVGIDPSETVALEGASRFTATVLQSATMPAGTAVGYGGTYVTAAPTSLAVVGVGYADGIPRELDGRAGVEIGGARHPIVGRISMDQIVVDTGDAVFPRGTAVTVYGPEGGPVPSVQEWARWAGTIPHTIVTGIGPRVLRSIA